MANADTLRHVRPSVIRWALELEGRLRSRDDKYPAWEDQDIEDLYEHFAAERREVDEVLGHYIWSLDEMVNMAVQVRAADELLDEAAISLMLKDRVEQWNPEEYQRGRLRKR